MLSLKEYVDCFMIDESSEQTAAACGHHVFVASVYITDDCGVDRLVFDQKVQGEKTFNPITKLVDKLTEVQKGSTRSYLSNGGDAEMTIPEKSCITIEIFANRSPNNVGADQLLKLLTAWKRKNIKVGISFNYAHALSLDNKYNRVGLKNLHDNGVKLKVLSAQQCLNKAMRDLMEQIESLDDLETCRGTIYIKTSMMKRAINKFTDGVWSGDDQLASNRSAQLKEIIGSNSQQQTAAATYSNKSTSNMMEPITFSVPTYRDYFLLQNSDEICVKMKLLLSKVKGGRVEEQILDARCLYLNTNTKSATANGVRASQEKELKKELWKLVGDAVTLSELSEHDEMIVGLTATMSEYPDRAGWYKVFNNLHQHINENICKCRIEKMKVQSSIRYATEETPTSAQDGIQLEYMNIRDILLDMLEDLEDDIKYVGCAQYGDQRATVNCDLHAISSGLGLLNRAINIKTPDGKMTNMCG